MCCRCTAALVACLLLAAAQRVAPFPDVNTADGLAAVIAARSAVVGSTRQLVLYSHTSYGGSSAPLWRAFAVELAASLDRVGHGNHIALAGSAAACADLPPAMYCAYDSLLAHHSATRPGVESLWVLRFHAATLLSLAGVGVTVLDSAPRSRRPLPEPRLGVIRTDACCLRCGLPAQPTAWSPAPSCPSWRLWSGSTR